MANADSFTNQKTGNKIDLVDSGAREQIEELNETLTESFTWRNITSQVTTTDAVSMVNSYFCLANKNIEILCGYFVVNPGTYTSSDTLLTLPVKPLYTSYAQCGDQRNTYVLRISTSGTIVFNTTTTIDSEQYVFSNAVFPIAQ